MNFWWECVSMNKIEGMGVKIKESNVIWNEL